VRSLGKGCFVNDGSASTVSVRLMISNRMELYLNAQFDPRLAIG
jgi:hypothetical protein